MFTGSHDRVSRSGTHHRLGVPSAGASTVPKEGLINGASVSCTLAITTRPATTGQETFARLIDVHVKEQVMYVAHTGYCSHPARVLPCFLLPIAVC